MHLSKKNATKLFWFAWLVYFCSYLGRLNYSAVMNELIDTNVVTKIQAGWVSTGFLIAYASGQLLNGMLADRINPRIMVCLGALGGGLLNLLFPLTESYALMLALRVGTGFCMSTLWPGIFSAMVRLMTDEDKLRHSIDISSSMSAGTLLSYVSSAVLLKYVSWRPAFYVPGVLLMTAGVLWFIAFGAIAGDLGRNIMPAAVPSAEKKQSMLPMSKLILFPCILAALVPVILHGVIKDGVTSWIPTYIAEVFHTSSAFAAFVSVLLPIANLTGAYLGEFMYKRMKQNPFMASAVYFGGAMLLFLVMLYVADKFIIPTVVCFALITSFMMAINVLMINLLPLKFQKYNRTSTISGGLNAVAYGGSALASGLIGVMSDAWGWNAALVSWLVMMVIAGGVCIVCKNTIFDKRLKEDEAV